MISVQEIFHVVAAVLNALFEGAASVEWGKLGIQ